MKCIMVYACMHIINLYALHMALLVVQSWVKHNYKLCIV